MIRTMNIEAQHRKKDPVRLHKQLLESAGTIAGRDGIWLSELTEGRTMSAEHRRSLVSDLTRMTLPA